VDWGASVFFELSTKITKIGRAPSIVSTAESFDPLLLADGLYIRPICGSISAIEIDLNSPNPPPTMQPAVQSPAKGCKATPSKGG
jgi:hypothetical protein